MIIRTILEAVAIILLIYGFINEKKVIAWEQKTCAKIKAKIKK